MGCSPRESWARESFRTRSLCVIPSQVVSALVGFWSCRSWWLRPSGSSRDQIRKGSHYRKVTRSPLSRGVLQVSNRGPRGNGGCMCFIDGFPTGHTKSERATAECVCQMFDLLIVDIRIFGPRTNQSPPKRSFILDCSSQIYTGLACCLLSFGLLPLSFGLFHGCLGL